MNPARDFWPLKCSPGLPAGVKLRLPAQVETFPYFPGAAALAPSSAPFWARLLIANLLAVICRVKRYLRRGREGLHRDH